MPFWPFTRKEPEPTTPPEVLERLIATAAKGRSRRLVEECQKHKQVVAANLDLMCTAPVAIRTNPAAMERYFQALVAVAQCLAEDCAAPELWNKLRGTPENNPLLRWDQWYGELPARMQRLEYPQLIAEAQEFIARAKSLQGPPARLHEAYLQGRLAELLFHSGRVAEAVPAFAATLELCRAQHDAEGQKIHLNNLLEAHRYLGNTAEAIRYGEEAIAVAGQHRLDCALIRRQVARLRRGEPLCRVVFAREGQQFELDELPPNLSGRYEFQFCRNRLLLQRSLTLVNQGNELASAGNVADALEKYQEAMEADPFDPDPVYQSGVCLLEMGAYAQAKERFAEVDNLAPGWFRCRSDRWLAEGLENGVVSEQEFRLLRLLEDGGLPPEQALVAAKKAVAEYPEFAPFYLCLGDLQRNREQTAEALASYRRGLALVDEPDLESRLLCAAAGILPVDSAKRREFAERAVALAGSLVAKAMAAVMAANGLVPNDASPS